MHPSVERSTCSHNHGERCWVDSRPEDDGWVTEGRRGKGLQGDVLKHSLS